mgnify:FL=1
MSHHPPHSRTHAHRRLHTRMAQNVGTLAERVASRGFYLGIIIRFGFCRGDFRRSGAIASCLGQWSRGARRGQLSDGVCVHLVGVDEFFMVRLGL